MDSGEFSVICRFQGGKLYSVLLDSGASVNLMPAEIARLLGIRELVRTTTGIHFGNQTIDNPIGIAVDVPINIHGVNFEEEFFIMDCAADKKTPIVLRRGFLTTARITLDFDKGTIVIRDEDMKTTLKERFGYGYDSSNIGVKDPDNC
ncbi:uncharacterized protein [Rutidosis leptorrhynchoides]|uniref:uncharacterized protein n=1 Tax=Rutidosis leptorrhynchoides TaxID=125765 RepID=UPI003A98D4D9